MEIPRILASRSHEKGIEVTTSAIPQYSSGRIGIASSMTKTKGSPGKNFAVIYGTKDRIEVSGNASSFPESFTVWARQTGLEKAEKVLFDKEQFERARHMSSR
ncbi:hypothetical protein N7490_010745 [Penicillium lividum]|nr:hypothetical protein N7490_010745 [Penicillium lividum]